ncbi:hypothetical protein A9Z42_0067570 [Trichoderma parareesei]|uniref:PQ loop repeat protein n=1 Tax=Trichoderma parareesei TaxID=858221 RepID=A0A2H2ZVL7_TRIPA|nr:hypothetical protein A9Z42_0067570 [Trichoderma parareesei]
MDNPVAANVLGTAGALIPQIIINYRRHDTTGLQPSMMMLWACAGVPLGVYNITKNFNVALRIQPQILTFLSLVTWAQCRYYDKASPWPHCSRYQAVTSITNTRLKQQKWPVSRCLLVATPIALLMAATQAALIFALRAAHSSHLTWPDTLMAVLSATLLAAGVLRHYWDIYVHRSVRGISFIFVGIDAGGDLFSLISVFFQPELDILGMVIYGTELALWIGVFACGGYFNLLPWIKQHFKTPSELHESRGSHENAIK